MSAAPQMNQAKSRILVMGPQARAFASALVRLNGNTDIFHAETAAEAVELLGNSRFDHVLIDNRTDGALTLTIPRLASMKSIGRLTVLAGPNSAETIAAIPGIGQVITPPYNPLDIADSLGIEVRDSRKNQVASGEHTRRAEDVMESGNPPAPEITADNIVASERDAAQAESDEPSLAVRILLQIVNFIPGLTPLISMLYKNVALTILAALFVAFVSYGIMIAFFLTSGDWSSPLQLQAGHELVVKAEREHSELLVKRNLASQQLEEARNKSRAAEEAMLRATSLSEMTSGIIDQETSNQTNRFAELKSEIEALESVLESYGSQKSRARERATVEQDFKRRIISRTVYQSSQLNFAQTERQVAELRAEITARKNEFSMMDQSIAYLSSLKNAMNGKPITAVGTGQTAYVPLTNQIMEVRQIRSNASAEIAATAHAVPSLENTISVLEKGIAALEMSPMIRAVTKPVNVLFVPYDNIDAYGESQPLYACAVTIFWCSKIGETGKAISGEITTTHPFFGKPIRGQFVEANLSDPTAAKKEIIHVGRPPFFF